MHATEYDGERGHRDDDERDSDEKAIHAYSSYASRDTASMRRSTSSLVV